MSSHDRIAEIAQECGFNDAYHFSLSVRDGLAVTGYHLARVRSHVEIHVRLRPTRAVEQCRHEIPVHKEILVTVTAALDGTDTVADVIGVGGEVTDFVTKIVRLEGDGTVVEVGIVL